MPRTDVPCPLCGADIPVELTATPGEMYGTDADGNRGEWRDGYVSVARVRACPTGCAFDDDTQADVDAAAEDAAAQYVAPDYADCAED